MGKWEGRSLFGDVGGDRCLGDVERCDRFWGCGEVRSLFGEYWECDRCLGGCGVRSLFWESGRAIAFWGIWRAIAFWGCEGDRC
ncbi:hypothetical protein VB711_19430 [Cronbergia sp. UHCC 0137]|uniref:hypothetical protein n=1 Tax=Cronbergia sp. UHCC 0137 TaxID=3110239 RepID=UPI002B1FB909|nr:hypothetical protein [Cronbergia sp. UHCC 0137]MEA5619999.1 hypothetical protein [Cronbergia sp. UHCC 0137]